MDTPFARLVIPKAILDAVLSQARAELPNECCGVLAGQVDLGVGTVSQHFPVRNDLSSPKSYATNPRDLLHVLRATRAAGTEWLAVYHSHPSSAAIPSRTDLANNTYGTSLVHLVLGLAASEPDLRAWWLGDSDWQPVVLEIG